MALYTREHLISSARIFEGRIFSVRQDVLRKTDAPEIVREVVEHNGGVVVVCQPEPNKVLLVKQYRYPIDEELLELPAGRVELGEDRLLAAKRELVEETGFSAGTWSELPAMYSAPGFCSELLSFYHACDLKWQGKQLDDDEETDVVIVDLEKVRELARTGQIRDAKTVAGLAMLFLFSNAVIKG